MARPTISTKRLMIDKANSTVVIAAGAAAFIFIFCAVATKTLISQLSYQNRVISAKRVTLEQLESNIQAVDTLQASYKSFNAASPNILGGNPVSNGALDGANPTLVLNALPSNYDFPALANSLEKIVAANGLEITSIVGSDDQVAQQENQTSSVPKPVPIPFQLAVSGDYQGVQNLVGSFERSIRPFQINSVQIAAAADQGKMVLTVGAQTFYQPAKSLNISTEVIK